MPNKPKADDKKDYLLKSNARFDLLARPNVDDELSDAEIIAEMREWMSWRMIETLGFDADGAAWFRSEIQAREQAAEIRGLDLIENAPRVPVELMSMVLERKKELHQLTHPQERTDHAK